MYFSIDLVFQKVCDYRALQRNVPLANPQFFKTSSPLKQSSQLVIYIKPLLCDALFLATWNVVPFFSVMNRQNFWNSFAQKI